MIMSACSTRAAPVAPVPVAPLLHAAQDPAALEAQRLPGRLHLAAAARHRGDLVRAEVRAVRDDFAGRGALDGELPARRGGCLTGGDVLRLLLGTCHGVSPGCFKLTG
jgi:hypothetical protein